MDFAIPLVLAVLGGGTFLVRRLLVSRVPEDDARTAEAWRQASRRLGGELELRPRSGRIAMDVEGIPLVLTALTKREDGLEEHTKAVAGPLPSAGGVALRVTPRNPITRRLRAGREGVGDSFDVAMEVTASPRAIASEFLDPPTRRDVGDVGGRFSIERGKLVVESEGIPLEAEPLIELGRFAERLVLRWNRLLRGPARVAAALGVDAAEFDLSSSSSIVGRGLLRGRALELVIRVDDERALTVVRFEDGGGGEWTIERGDDDLVVTGDAPDPVRSAARVQGPALLGLRRIDGFIELAFDGLSPAPPSVTAATLAVLDTSVQAYR